MVYKPYEIMKIWNYYSHSTNKTISNYHTYRICISCLKTFSISNSSRWFSKVISKKLFQVSIFSIKIHLCLIQSIFDTRTIKISSCCFFVYLNLLKGKKLRWKLLIFINMLKTVDLEQITSAFYAINCRVSNMRKKCLFILLCNVFKYISLFSNSSLLYCWLSLSTM